jgi:hypothetical protein
MTRLILGIPQGSINMTYTFETSIMNSLNYGSDSLLEYLYYAISILNQLFIIVIDILELSILHINKFHIKLLSSIK